jgi:hypothetical protein
VYFSSARLKCASNFFFIMELVCGFGIAGIMRHRVQVFRTFVFFAPSAGGLSVIDVWMHASAEVHVAAFVWARTKVSLGFSYGNRCFFGVLGDGPVGRLGTQ